MQTLKLYELTDEWRALMEQVAEAEVDPETGELPPELSAALDGVEENIRKKAGNVAVFIRNLEATECAIKSELDRLNAWHKSCARKVDWLKAYLLENMEKAQLDTISEGLVAVSVRKSPASVVVADLSKVPGEWFKPVKPATESDVDKSRFLSEWRALGGNLEVPGMTVVTDRKYLKVG